MNISDTVCNTFHELQPGMLNYVFQQVMKGQRDFKDKSAGAK